MVIWAGGSLKELAKAYGNKESLQQAQKRPNKHGSNNSTVGMTKWHDRSASRPTKGVKNGLEKEKPTIKQGPTL